MEGETKTFLSNIKVVSRYFTHDGIEWRSFRSCLRRVCLDQSNSWRAGLSWSIFFILTFVVPILSHFLLLCPTCDENHSRPYHVVVQSYISVFATLSFVSLSRWHRKFGLRRFLFLDKLCDASDKVQRGYAEQLQRSMKLILLFGLPCSVAECVYKVWWYVSGANEIPYYGNKYLSITILCTLEICSWVYRTSVFFLVCVLFQLLCHLQMLKLEEFAQVFHKETEVRSILVEHLISRRNLRIISHRFRVFILLSLIFVTASQLNSLLMTLRTGANVNIFKAGELTLCSINLLAGLYIILRSATKKHRRYSLMQLMFFFANWGSEDEEGDGDDELDNTKMVPIYAHTISSQKRQALVTYMEHNRAGVTVFGFMLDRTSLRSIFAIELPIFLWLLNKTIGIS
ncbi:DUF3537 domain-containing protein [Quillaja saponaria]|uniref:DUF3537 domain-containing protein n=1 Tax=Quillaja saponaria TaxID=32244 RepID=A0AAD7KUQ3_QUISA|nr:DUF3537 domain-containing protein [Quillaja saponaria]